MSIFNVGNLQNFQDIIGQFNAAQTAANDANEQRFGELTGLLRNLQTRTGANFDRLDAETSDIGNVARRRIAEGANQQFANAQQQLISRGLGNSTLINAALRSTRSDQERREQEVDEQQALLRAGNIQARTAADQSTTQALAGAIERRTDVGPDTGLFANLLQQAAANQPTRRTVRIGNRPTGPVSPSNFVRGGGGTPRTRISTIRNTAQQPTRLPTQTFSNNAPSRGGGSGFIANRRTNTSTFIRG